MKTQPLKFTKVNPFPAGLVSGWVTSDIYPFVKQKHWTENTINANKCELSKVQILLACFTQNKNIILKAYSTQKVGPGDNFESGNQGYAADGKYKLAI